MARSAAGVLPRWTVLHELAAALRDAERGERVRGTPGVCALSAVDHLLRGDRVGRERRNRAWHLERRAPAAAGGARHARRGIADGGRPARVRAAGSPACPGGSSRARRVRSALRRSDQQAAHEARNRVHPLYAAVGAAYLRSVQLRGPERSTCVGRARPRVAPASRAGKPGPVRRRDAAACRQRTTAGTQAPAAAIARGQPSGGRGRRTR